MHLRRCSYIAFCVSLVAGCTFITECPPVESNANGGTSGSGSGKGGSGNDAGAGDAGGAPNPTGSGGTGNVIVGGGEGGGGTAPDGEWVNVTSNLAGVESECGNLAFLSSKPDRDMLIASVALKGLWASTDGDEEWVQLGQAEDSESIDNRATSFAYDPETPEVFWTSGMYGTTGGIFRTDDDGETFVRLGDISHNDAVAVDFSDPDRQTLLATSHEQQIIYKSSDGGETWEEIQDSLPEGIKVCSSAAVLDADTYLLGCAGGFDEGDPAIIRTTDGGGSWDIVAERGGAKQPLFAADGSIYWAAEFGEGLVRSEDDGETWETMVAGTIDSVAPVELPDGRIASLIDDAVAVSEDQGRTWRIVSTKAPITPVALVYSPFRKAFYVYYFTCAFPSALIPDDAMQRYDFDYETE
jgi:photosystem II stability/assembly factor-like uncharacterized protein